MMNRLQTSLREKANPGLNISFNVLHLQHTKTEDTVRKFEIRKYILKYISLLK
jgi:hypothetical protein